MTNRPSPTHLLKYATHKICLSIITDLSNIWNSIQEKLKQSWDWVVNWYWALLLKKRKKKKKMFVVSGQDQSHTVFRTTTTIAEQSPLLKND